MMPSRSCVSSATPEDIDSMLNQIVLAMKARPDHYLASVVSIPAGMMLSQFKRLSKPILFIGKSS
jgi:hypothetical protein